MFFLRMGAEQLNRTGIFRLFRVGFKTNFRRTRNTKWSNFSITPVQPGDRKGIKTLPTLEGLNLRSCARCEKPKVGILLFLLILSFLN